MDPDANLREQLALARAIQALIDRAPEPNAALRAELMQKADRLAELVLALNEWRAIGGLARAPARPEQG